MLHKKTEVSCYYKPQITECDVDDKHYRCLIFCYVLPDFSVAKLTDVHSKIPSSSMQMPVLMATAEGKFLSEQIIIPY